MAEEEKSKRKWVKNVNKPGDTHEPDMEPYRATDKPDQADNDKAYRGGSLTSKDYTRTKDYQKALASPKAIRNGFYGTKD